MELRTVVQPQDIRVKKGEGLRMRALKERVSYGQHWANLSMRGGERRRLSPSGWVAEDTLVLSVSCADQSGNSPRITDLFAASECLLS